MTMRTQNSVFMFLTLFIILGFIGVTSCRHINEATSKEIYQRLRDKYSPIFLRSYSAIRRLGKPGSGTSKIMIIGSSVSLRAVPGGPNPLHNWCSNSRYRTEPWSGIPLDGSFLIPFCSYRRWIIFRFLICKPLIKISWMSCRPIMLK